ncbi:MAG: fibronectin type III domain-containing protein [Sphingobacteriales bacterium]
MKSRALINFSKYTDGAFESKVHTILSCMKDNLNFTTPVPDLAAITAAAAAYSAALIKASTGNRENIADKNEKRRVLTNLLRSLCIYVTLTANGDRIVLLSSGFDISKDAEPMTISKPENLQVINGISSGELLVSVNAVKGAYAYLHEYTIDETLAPGSWVVTPSTSSKITFTNLLSGTKYYCRVGAIGTNGQLLYSDPLARIVA